MTCCVLVFQTKLEHIGLSFFLVESLVCFVVTNLYIENYTELLLMLLIYHVHFWSFLYFEPIVAVWNPKANPEKETSKPSNIVENVSDNPSKRLTFPGKIN